MTRSLNLGQRDFLQHITYFFNTASASTPPIHAFISGGTGVGNSVYQSVSHVFNREAGSNPDDIRILLCAPTGKAAFGIGGQIIHSAFALPVSQAGYSMPNLSASVSNTLACKLAKLKLIIIDEISMVGARTFHQINLRLQQIFCTHEYFGGVSVIVVGDFRQLPPVGDNWIFQPNHSRNPLASLAGSPLWELFKFFELKTIMRQRSDAPFAIALNNIASGTMTDNDLLLMKARCFKQEDIPPGAVHLFHSNKHTCAYNELVLGKMKPEGAIVIALDEVFGEPNISAKHKALQNVALLPTSQTYGLPHKLLLKVDARYMPPSLH
ncbi:ATP-dependent DNA helicase pif1-like [Hermetia illucens]|uniref:ATP-dependent DNA helicase pif1-like n=1 Tax=Hermetia illucens TaxID=343691 RepID=UPI0018CC1069|nr:ATP-dependent DNA helicase pif1-like [Hermetia illucens]